MLLPPQLPLDLPPARAPRPDVGGAPRARRAPRPAAVPVPLPLDLPERNRKREKKRVYRAVLVLRRAGRIVYRASGTLHNVDGRQRSTAWLLQAARDAREKAKADEARA